jgi:hypothetical protein
MRHIVGEASAEADLTADKRDALKAYGVCQTASVSDMITVFRHWTERNRQDWDKTGNAGFLLH